MEAIKPWISRRIHDLLGIDDEVLYEYVVNMLEESLSPDPKTMQVNLTGFFEDKTEDFMQSLWKVLIEAQKSPGGIPESFIRQKIEELKRQREEQDTIKANIKAAEMRAAAPTSLIQSSRKTRAGKKSRWDAPAAPAASDRGLSQNNDGQGSTRRDGRDRSKEGRSRYSRSRSPREGHRRGAEDSRKRRRDHRAKSPSQSPIYSKSISGK
ncbi:hypothetical protein FB639_003161 [Coemansia asiatica]|nr:hypothetical protein FB639_003161 [Coemansia asiatica]